MSTDDSHTGRQRFSTQVDADVQARAKAAVEGVRRSSKGSRNYSLAQLTTDALRAEVDKLADDYNDGMLWEPADEPLPPGRR